ncbi:MAG: hypothetical protein NUV85_04525 [Candidatus Berkelbacteria bacterium]|nr:hypothetical protein [Candidatus Berkelbacteria bacterium]
MSLSVKSRDFWLSPVTYLVSAALFYGVFEVLNASIVCNTNKLMALTGVFSFLGFWSLIASVVATYSYWRDGKKPTLTLIGIPVLVVVLFILDATIGKFCPF